MQLAGKFADGVSYFRFCQVFRGNGLHWDLVLPFMDFVDLLIVYFRLLLGCVDTPVVGKYCSEVTSVENQ